MSDRHDVDTGDTVRGSQPYTTERIARLAVQSVEWYKRLYPFADKLEPQTDKLGRKGAVLERILYRDPRTNNVRVTDMRRFHKYVEKGIPIHCMQMDVVQWENGVTKIEYYLHDAARTPFLQINGKPVRAFDLRFEGIIPRAGSTVANDRDLGVSFLRAEDWAMYCTWEALDQTPLTVAVNRDHPHGDNTWGTLKDRLEPGVADVAVAGFDQIIDLTVRALAAPKVGAQLAGAAMGDQTR